MFDVFNPEDGNRVLQEMQQQARLAELEREIAKIHRQNEARAILRAEDGPKISPARRLFGRLYRKVERADRARPARAGACD